MCELDTTNPHIHIHAFMEYIMRKMKNHSLIPTRTLCEAVFMVHSKYSK